MKMRCLGVVETKTVGDRSGLTKMRTSTSVSSAEFEIHQICWYTGGDKRIVAEGRICHIVGNGSPEHRWAKPFRRGQLYFVLSGTPDLRLYRIMVGDGFASHAAWVHPRHLILLEGTCFNCDNLKPQTDYICIKCRSAGVAGL